MSGNYYIEVKAKYVHHTAGAVRVVRASDGVLVWIPRSAIQRPVTFQGLKDGDPITISAQEWTLKQNGMLPGGTDEQHPSNS